MNFQSSKTPALTPATTAIPYEQKAASYPALPDSFRLSASFLTLWRECKFKSYCKISGQPKDWTDMKYADAGTVVHESLEAFYNGKSREEVKALFTELWAKYKLALDIDTYWTCVVNGMNRKLKPSHTEREIRLEEPFPFLGYIDIMNDKENWLADWKTSSWSSEKEAEYSLQLKLYAYVYRKMYGVIPKTWVLFNKIDRIAHFKFTDAQLDEIERECKAIVEDIKLRWAEQRFERSPSEKNCFFCPYKSTCAGPLLKAPKKEETLGATQARPRGELFKFLIEGDMVGISGPLTEKDHARAEHHCNFYIKNAHFIIKVMRSKGNLDYDGIKRTYWRKPYGAKVAAGYVNSVARIIRANHPGAAIKVDDRRDKGVMDFVLGVPQPEKLDIPFQIQKHQLEAVEKLIKHRWGAISSATGSGKTLMAAEAIRRVWGKTLFVIDNKDLLLQTKKEYEKMLGVPGGIVGMGKREWQYPIIFGTIQTLAKNAKEWSDKLATFNTVILDESHVIAARSYEILSKYLVNTKYRWGFSATQKRDDENDKLIFSRTGEVVYTVTAQEMIDIGFVVPPKAIFYKAPRPMGIMVGGDGGASRHPQRALTGTQFHDEYTTYISGNVERNLYIRKIAMEYVAQGKSVMILAKDIKNGQIPWLVENVPKAELIYGATKDDVRKDVLDRFKARETLCLIGNISMFNKGINIPVLDVVINAAGGAGEVRAVQTIGRVMRKSEGKTEGIYIDFIDNGDFLYDHSQNRIKALKAQGYEVELRED